MQALAISSWMHPIIQAIGSISCFYHCDNYQHPSFVVRSNLAADLLVFIVCTGNPLETPLELVRNEESIPVKEFEL